MPDHAQVTVDAEEAPAVLEALLSLYGARADALAELAGRTDAGRLQEARAALLDADAALDTFGWERGDRLAPAELSGPPRLVGEVLATAVADAAELFDAVLEAYGRGHATLVQLRDAHEALTRLLAMFAAHESEHEI